MIQLKIHGLGPQFILDIDEEEFKTLKVKDLKLRIIEHKGLSRSPDELRAIAVGHQLDNEKLLSEYSIKNATIINIVQRVNGGKVQ